MNGSAADLLAGVVALAALVTGARVWLRVTAPLVSSESSAECWLDRLLILCWLAVGFFYPLAGLAIFELWTAVGVVLLSAFAAGFFRRGDPPTGSHPVRCLEPPDPRDPWLWAAIPVLGVAAVRLVKSLAAPPLSWDAMTMHLPKPAFWIQSASLTLPDFPDAWTYYRWFPEAGEILFAWVMLPFRSDLLLGPFGALVWLAVLVAGARLARHLGAGGRTSWLAGAALAGLPAVLVFMTANYVDNLVLLFMLLAVTHASSFAKTGQSRNAVLSLGAAGLAIGTKTSALAMAAPLVATVTILVWQRRGRTRLSAVALMGAALVVPCAGYFHTWVHTGSPLYPFKAPLLPLPYHQALADLFAGRFLPAGAPVERLGPVLERLFWSEPNGQGHMNFGLGGAVLAVTALAGLIQAVRRKGRSMALWLTLAGAAVSTPLVFTAGNLALRTVWIGVLGRHLLPAFAPVFLWVGLAPKRVGQIALAASLLVTGLHFLPLGWSPAMTRPALEIGAGLVVLLALTLGIGRVAWISSRPLVRWSVTAIASVVFLFVWAPIRANARYEIYRETRQQAFDAHPLHPTFATSASLWPALDTAKPLTLALTVGKDPVGHNQFFYPLLGSRLQNRLIYVPTAEGDVRLEPTERYARADPERWLEELERRAPDLVVGLWPVTPERRWLGSRPNDFEVVALTSLGAPWVGRRRDQPPLFDLQVDPAYAPGPPDQVGPTEPTP